MVDIFAPGGTELATKNMIPGNGINLLDGTKDFSNVIASGSRTIVEDANDRITSSEASTKIIHVFNGDYKSATLKYQKELHLVPGYYVLSFIVLGNDDSLQNTPTMSVLNNNTVLATSNVKIINKATFVHLVFKVENIDPINLSIGEANNPDAGLPGNSLWYANLKLEAGVNPTPWSESPVDQIQELKSSLSK